MRKCSFCGGVRLRGQEWAIYAAIRDCPGTEKEIRARLGLKRDIYKQLGRLRDAGVVAKVGREYVATYVRVAGPEEENVESA